MGDFILNLTIVIATLWIVQRFWGSFYEKKRKTVLSIITWISFFIFQIISQWNIGNLNISMTVINVLLIFLISVCGYQSKGKAKYFLVVIFCVVWSLMEFFAFFLLSSIQLEQENFNRMGMVISVLLMLISVYILSVVWSKSDNEFISNRLYLYLLLVPIGSIYIAVNEFYYKGNNVSATLIISILILFNIIIFEIYTKLNELFLYEKEGIVYAQQINMSSYNTLEQRKVMEDFHEEKHNLINSLIVLKDGIENDDKETVIKNLDRIINRCHNEETISNSGNSIIDAVINFKYAVAGEYGIAFRLKIFIPDELPIEPCDIGVLLGNALDNAIEAVRVCKSKEKIIEISMGVRKEAWIMVIKNPYEHEIRQDRSGEIMSTKKENCRHGYGLKSIKKIAEAYYGEVITNTDGGVFTLTVVLNLGNFDSQIGIFDSKAK